MAEGDQVNCAPPAALLQAQRIHPAHGDRPVASGMILYLHRGPAGDGLLQNGQQGSDGERRMVFGLGGGVLTQTALGLVQQGEYRVALRLGEGFLPVTYQRKWQVEVEAQRVAQQGGTVQGGDDAHPVGGGDILLPDGGHCSRGALDDGVQAALHQVRRYGGHEARFGL